MNNATNLEKLDNVLKNENADYSIFNDNFSIETASSGAEHYGISLSETTPTLILKTNDQYIAVIICGNTRISFKKLKQILNTKDVNMADPQTILNLTGAKIGEVSLINPGLTTFIDAHVLQNKDCYGGCGVPKTTLRINTQDLIRITNAQVLDFAELRS
jgi:prolyl-tRNA editing enzyme YbaK/EbsC (Cys-tRNA(Pro) deacylase)